jgi:hypothetical protein
MSHRSPPLLLPRGLIFLASLWLIGSWIVAIGIRAPVQPSSATYTPNVRLMLICVTAGLMLGWPLLRLSQDRPPYPLRQTWLDLIVLLGLVQVVIWPLRLVTSWTPQRTAAIDATLAGWVLLAGAVIAAAITTDRRGPRTLAMTACVGMCLMGPGLAWLGASIGLNAMQLVEVSPFMAVRSLADAGGGQPSGDKWLWIIVLAAADLAAWMALTLAAAVRRNEVPQRDHGADEAASATL